MRVPKDPYTPGECTLAGGGMGRDGIRCVHLHIPPGISSRGRASVGCHPWYAPPCSCHKPCLSPGTSHFLLLPLVAPGITLLLLQPPPGPLTKAICPKTHSLWVQMGDVGLNTLLAPMPCFSDSNAGFLKNGLQLGACDKHLNRFPYIIL